MTKHDIVQLYLDKISQTHGCTHESETYSSLRNILDFLANHARPNTLLYLNYHRLKQIAQLQGDDESSVRILKLTLYILSDPQINVLEQMFEVHNDLSNESISMDFQEFSQYIIDGSRYIHPITEQEVDAKTFSDAVTSYFKISQDFCQEVMS
ncbi:hypothetical protein LU290_04940 [Moraxella nasibovis]|uniref:hypothetical protein n=1 Tax=Moraxella nasibovis TaxID=2904120 RepID=UPI00240EC980|nr:hypothetical protein [Moraxella nasibovis]WFF39566.1 hypothetical protein LU290_04940 [Moraxella nasibovis]